MKYIHQRFEPSDENNPSIAHAIATAIDNVINEYKKLWEKE